MNIEVIFHYLVKVYDSWLYAHRCSNAIYHKTAKKLEVISFKGKVNNNFVFYLISIKRINALNEMIVDFIKWGIGFRRTNQINISLYYKQN